MMKNRNDNENENENEEFSEKMEQNLNNENNEKLANRILCMQIKAPQNKESKLFLIYSLCVMFSIRSDLTYLTCFGI